MKLFLKSNLVILFFLFISFNNFSQNDTNINVFGLIIEEETKQPIPFASIVLYQKNTTKIITGTTSDENGKFNVKTLNSDFHLTISFIGFQTKKIEVFSVSNKKIDLGKIFLKVDSQTLDEVVIKGELSKTVFKLDKRVFSVGKDISSTGASALEVLNKVPSVNVGIEGNISLRGSTGVQILINGKPSILADESSNVLGTITADMIESIEVITNPSAKYEASGTAGILNIILKKEEKKGWNGSFSLNTGIPDNHSLGFSVNRRTDNFNLFAQLGAGHRSLPRENEAINKNLVSNETVFSDGIEYRNETFFNITLGTDYHINKLNVLTLSGNFAYEIEDQPSETNFRFLDANNQLISSWLRSEVTDATNPKYQYELNYKKEFKNNEEHTLQLSALGSFFGKDQASQFTNTTFSGADINNDQETETHFLQADYTFKFDYVNPFTDKFTLETGVQYVINDVVTILK